MFSKATKLILFGALFGLAGCGGGGDTPTSSTPNSNQSSALQSGSTLSSHISSSASSTFQSSSFATSYSSHPTVSSESSSSNNTRIGETHRYPVALGTTSATPRQIVTSYLSSNGTLHLAWVQDMGEAGDQIHYATQSPSGSLVTSAITHPKLARIWSIKMAVTDTNSVHLVFHGRRDVDAGIRSGNYAIYYAGGDNGQFTISQVSSNPISPGLNTGGLYDAYVNGRPEIFIDDTNAPVVVYDAAQNSANNWDTFLTVAKYQGGNWSHQRRFNIDSQTLTFNPSAEYQVPNKHNFNGPFIRVDWSNYDVHSFAGNQLTDSMIGFGGFTNVVDVQALSDTQGKFYATWLRDQDADDKVEKDYSIYLVAVEQGIFNSYYRIPIEGKSITGNHAPAAIDPITNQFYMMYFEGALGVLQNTRIANFDLSRETYGQAILPKDLGIPFGQDALWAYNNTLVYVGVSSGSLVITRWDNAHIIFNTAQVSQSSNSSSSLNSSLPSSSSNNKWSVKGTVDASDCDEGISSYVSLWEITQNDNTLSAKIDGADYTGSLSNNKVTWNGTVTEDGGTTRNQFQATFNGNSMSGFNKWSYTDDEDYSCSGTTTYTGSKL